MSDNRLAAILVSSATASQPALQFAVGIGGVTEIKLVEKPGPYSNIPFVRVYTNKTLVAEFCQLNIVGVYHFGPRPQEEAEALMNPYPEGGG